MKVVRRYNLYEVFYRYAGEKRSRLCMNYKEVAAAKRELKRNRRKYLGTRNVELVEVA